MLRRPIKFQRSLSSEKRNDKSNLTGASDGSSSHISSQIRSPVQHLQGPTGQSTSPSSSSKSSSIASEALRRRRHRKKGGDPYRWLMQFFVCLPCMGLTCLYLAFFFVGNNHGAYPAIGSAAGNLLSPFLTARTCEATLVTAYYPLKSKYSAGTYQEWIANFLSLTDCMVIYTSPDMVSTFSDIRAKNNLQNRTIIVDSAPLHTVPLVSQYSTSFWQQQLTLDPEKRVHQSYHLFWIWIAKTWFVYDVATQRNPFGSQYFVWMDMGCFRNKRYNGKQILQKAPDVIPRDRVLFLAHHATNPPPSPWWTEKTTDKEHFYHSGTIMAGTAHSWMTLYEAHKQTLRGFTKRHLFIGDDQVVMQGTCLQHPKLCAYILHNQVKDNHYFGLRFALYQGGTYDLWYPPIGEIQIEQEDDDVPEPTAKQSEGDSKTKLNVIEDPSVQLKKCPNTVVTGYFVMPSKFSSDRYNDWMRHMLSLQDCMVIYTSPQLVAQMQSHRNQHAKDKTVIIAMEIDDLPLARQYDAKFWQHQLDIDPEKNHHRSYQLFWIWLSKSWFVTESIRQNFFDSDIFAWSDIGCFRNAKYDKKEMILHREQVPRDSIMQMAHHPPNPPPNKIWWNDKYRQKSHFYHSGSQAVGYKDTWLRYHKEFLQTIEGFLAREMFIGEDQTVAQSTCLRNPALCAYISYDQVRDNHYFGLRYVLHEGGEYKIWRSPAVKSPETEQ